MRELFTSPFKDYLVALTAIFQPGIYLNLLILVSAFLFSWWIYVPVHELFHAFGCILSGGEVTELSISGAYGATFLKQYFPYVKQGSEYAGQLTGFNTYGNDIIFFITDFFPYLLTIFTGVPLLRSVKINNSRLSSLKLGLAMPVAYAPFISIAGDYYEMGSIIVTGIINCLYPGYLLTEEVRGDDLFKILDEVIYSGNQMPDFGDVTAVVLSVAVGITFAFLTYFAGKIVSRTIFKVGTD